MCKNATLPTDRARPGRRVGNRGCKDPLPYPHLVVRVAKLQVYLANPSLKFCQGVVDGLSQGRCIEWPQP